VAEYQLMQKKIPGRAGAAWRARFDFNNESPSIRFRFQHLFRVDELRRFFIANVRVFRVELS
jgi:hypothetical protein